MNNHTLFFIFIIVFLFNCSKKVQNTDFQESEERKEYKIVPLTRVLRNSSRGVLAIVNRNNIAKIIGQADSVVAYNWNGNNGSSANTEHYIVDMYGKFDNKITKQFQLTKNQIQGLKNILIDKSNYEYEGSTATCFVPHIAFVYYQRGEIIGQSNVCFLCAGIKSLPKFDGELNESGIEKLKNFCKSIGLTIIDDLSQTNKG
jgi:hypothetical protein